MAGFNNIARGSGFVAPTSRAKAVAVAYKPSGGGLGRVIADDGKGGSDLRRKNAIAIAEDKARADAVNELTRNKAVNDAKDQAIIAQSEAAKAKAGREVDVANMQLANQAIGMAPEQVAAREAQQQFSQQQKSEADKAKWRNTINFAKEATEMQPDNNGIIKFKDPSVLAGVVDNFNPYEQVTAPDGTASFQQKKVLGRWVSQGDGKPEKLNLFTLDQDGIEHPITMSNGSTVTPTSDALVELSKFSGLYETQSGMKKAVAARQAKQAEFEQQKQLESIKAAKGIDPATSIYNQAQNTLVDLQKLANENTVAELPVPPELAAAIKAQEKRVAAAAEKAGVPQITKAEQAQIDAQLAAIYDAANAQPVGQGQEVAPQGVQAQPVATPENPTALVAEYLRANPNGVQPTSGVSTTPIEDTPASRAGGINFGSSSVPVDNSNGSAIYNYINSITGG